VTTSERVSVNASRSENADIYRWDFTGDDRTDASGVTAGWTYQNPGTKEIDLYVAEQNGENDSLVRTITVQSQSNTTTPTTTPTATPDSAPAPPAETPTPDAGGETPMPASTPAQTPTDTPDPAASDGQEPDNAGTYSISTLRRGGEQPDDAPSSVRYLGETGALGIRFVPANPLQTDEQYLEPGADIRVDDLQLRSARFGDDIDPRDVTVRVVFWEPDTREVQTDDGTRTETYAANQEVHSFDATLGTQYDSTGISLPSHYATEMEATMWLEDENGNRIDGARWRFSHQTSELAQAVPVNTRADLWWWAGKNIFLVAVPGLLLSAFGVRSVLNKTGRGPEKGPMWWGIVVLVGAFLIAAVGYFYTAQLLARLPQVFGLLIVAIAAIAMLETMGPTTRTDEFLRHELGDATNTVSEGIRDVLYREKARVRTVHRDDGLGLIKPGIRPFLARLFADPAVIETQKLKTKIENTGPDDRTFVASPESDYALFWQPARWSFEPRLFGGGEDRLGSLRGLNMALIGLTAVGGVVSALAFRYVFNAPTVGAAVGAAVAFVTVSARAKDGEAAFDPAPVHFRDASASLTAMQVAYRESKDIHDAWEMVWEERSRTAKDAKKLEEQRDETLSQQMLEEEMGDSASQIGSFEVTEPGEGEQPDDEAVPEDAQPDETDDEAAADGGVNEDE
jgi:hypothetical protein